jgi:hypothetical protein
MRGVEVADSDRASFSGEKTFFPFQGSGLVFSATYPRGIFAPSAFHPSGWLRFPPKIRHEKDSALSPVT